MPCSPILGVKGYLLSQTFRPISFLSPLSRPAGMLGVNVARDKMLASLCKFTLMDPLCQPRKGSWWQGEEHHKCGLGAPSQGFPEPCFLVK